MIKKEEIDELLDEYDRLCRKLGEEPDLGDYFKNPYKLTRRKEFVSYIKNKIKTCERHIQQREEDKGIERAKAEYDAVNERHQEEEEYKRRLNNPEYEQVGMHLVRKDPRTGRVEEGQTRKLNKWRNRVDQDIARENGARPGPDME